MTTLTRRVQYTAGTSIKSLPITFPSTMTVHTDLNVVRDHNVAFIITPLFLEVTIHVYIDVIS